MRELRTGIEKIYEYRQKTNTCEGIKTNEHKDCNVYDSEQQVWLRYLKYMSFEFGIFCCFPSSQTWLAVLIFATKCLNVFGFEKVGVVIQYAESDTIS